MTGRGRPRPVFVSRRAVFLTLVVLAGIGGAGATLADAWRETRRREAYLPELEAMARRAPADGRLLGLLGGRLAQAREYPAAAGALKRALAAGERDEIVWRSWAAALAASGEGAQARAALQLGLREARGPDAAALRAALERSNAPDGTPSPEALAQSICPEGTGLLVGRYAGGSFLNALAEWRGRRRAETSGFATRERWAREDPDNARALVLWARALQRNRRLPEAEQAAQRALARAPRSPEAHLALGDILFEGGVVSKAGLAYVAALKLRPDWLPALIGLGNVAVEKKLLALAVSTFEKAAEMAPDNPDVWVGLGRAHYNQKFRFDRSLEAFQKAERLAPRRTDYFPYYSDALRASYQPEAREAILRRRVAAAPEDARSRYLLALALLDNRRTPAREAEAEQQLRASLLLESRATAAQARLGQLLLERGRPADAAEYLKAALEGDPYNALAMTMLARAYRRAGDAKRATAAGEAATRLSRYAQRKQALEDAEHANPLSVEIHRKLARLFEEGGEREKARSQREMVYMLEHHPRQAQRGLSALNAATTLSVGGSDPPVTDRSR